MLTISNSSALKLAELIRQSFEIKPFQNNLPSSVFITLSIGVASYPLDSNDKDELVEVADKALYLAKKSGRNKVSA